MKEKLNNLYNKNYKLLLLIPLILVILSLSYLGYFYSQNNDFIKKDITLTGGTSLTFFPQEEIQIDLLKEHLSQNVNDFSVRELSNFRTGRQEAIVIESPIDSSELKSVLEDYLGYKFGTEDFSVEFTGSKFGESFYNQLIFAIFISFILMALVVFIIFRTIITYT